MTTTEWVLPSDADWTYEPEWCNQCEAPTEIVDVHDEGDYRVPGQTFRVHDLACGHSHSWRIK